MATSINEVRLLGNVGNDPEIRSTADGGKVASFSLATTKRWTDSRSGEKREKTQWHKVVCWNRGSGKLADLVEQHVHKGDRVHVAGEIEYREWSDRVSGEPRHATEISAEDVVFLTPKKDAEPAAPTNRRTALAK